MIRRRLLLPVLALLALTPVGGVAHEMGSTRVAIWISADRYRVEIVTDAQALADKLAAASREAPGAALGAPEVRGFAERLRERVTLAIDGIPVDPDVSYVVSPAAHDIASVVTIQLTGPLPARARTLEWTFGWTYAAYSLTVHRPDQAQPIVSWLNGGESSAPIDLTGPAPVRSRFQVAARYLRLGFAHIVPYGLDHVLFVLGIFLLARQLRPLLLQVTAFTVAHSITLALGIFGVVAIAPSVVEPLIALSIAYVAIENLLVRTVKPWRIVVVFVFGLLHGLGFAGVLQELGLPQSEFITALIAFNLGVEAGQLAVIGAAFLLVGVGFGHRPWYRRRIVIPASVLIGCVGIYWTVQRFTP
ncbi:MAG TPA: HupE/UreJ family protein [Vicinamibacterales bacterium]|nr:HupE/UreJ family protein [Vicinamibacterales bacterium]